MSVISNYNSYKSTFNEYSAWRDKQDLREARREEYLRRNPNAIKDYDLQRSKILLNAVDIMDKSIIKNSDNNIDMIFSSTSDLGLGYAAAGGTTLGLLLTKLKPIEKFITKLTKNNPKSKNIVTMGITATSGVLGILAAYPAYNAVSKIESKIYRKRRFDTMEKELSDPKIFTVLDEKQKEIFLSNLDKIKELDNKKQNKNKVIKNSIKDFKKLSIEALRYDKEQNLFKTKYEENKDLYDLPLSEKQIKDAKKDRELLINLVKKMNISSQSYSEKMERFADNLIALTFALGSLFTLVYERIAKTLNIKSSSLPAGLSVVLLIGSTFFASWAQKRAELVGRFKAKQDLMESPEQLVYISSTKTKTIDDEELNFDDKSSKKKNMFVFLKDFFIHNKEYKAWLKSDSYSGNEISKAMENIDLTPEQLKDGERLQKNMFKTFYRVDKNTQNYSNAIDIMGESVKYPITLVLGTIGSVWGMKHLAKLRGAKSALDILKHSIKYTGTIALFTLPTMFVNAHFAKIRKNGARVSDMVTIKNLQDYRFFADYSEQNI